MAFDPNQHMMKLKGKDYLQVMWRLVWFREDHPDYGLATECLNATEDYAMFKAIITDANGIVLSTGHGSESKRDFGDFLEKAETKAIGRALAMLGYGTQFAPDLDEGERIVDSPVARIKPEPLPEDALKPGEKLDLPKPGDWDPRKVLSAWCKGVGLTMQRFGEIRKELISKEIVPDIPSGELSMQEFDMLCKAVLKHEGKA